ncbi:MAG: HAD-IIB family hydrolase [Shimia sp.]
MFVMHIALGGCLTAPHPTYGLTEDTGGHIAYVLGAAQAQAARGDVDRVEIVTRAFDAPALGAVYDQEHQIVGPKLAIRRLRTEARGYLSKEGLVREVPALSRAFVAQLTAMARRPDVIHAHFADAAVLARAAEDRFGIRMVYTPHSLGIDKVQCGAGGEVSEGLAQRIAQETAAMEAADAIVVSSRDEAERQIAAYGARVCGKVHRIWPGLTRPEGPARAAEALVGPMLNAPARPMILAIARPVERKNLVHLARTYAASAPLQARANLVILAGQHGPGTDGNDETRGVLNALRGVAAGLPGRMALPPRHAPSDVGPLYALARATRGVFVNPALHEPFGLTLLEAAAHGLPVVATSEGGPPDILAEIGNGETVAPRDGAALEAALLRVLDAPGMWAARSAAAVAGVGAFSWEVWAARVQDVYAPPRRAVRTPVAARRPAILVSDIDDTLTGCRIGAAAFARWAAQRDIPFAVATGRSITEARAVLATWALPEPDVFVTAVGSEIHHRDATGRWRLHEAYAAHIAAGWDRAACLEVLRATIAPQPAIEQRGWKLAGFGDADDAARLRAALAERGLAARVVASHGRLIDLLPVAVGKGAALDWVASLFGLGRRDCIAAGNAGNDTDMLIAAGRGIVVGNALDDEVAPALAHPHVHRVASAHAAGVLEGLAACGAVRAAPRATRPATAEAMR